MLLSGDLIVAMVPHVALREQVSYPLLSSLEVVAVPLFQLFCFTRTTVLNVKVPCCVCC